MVAVISILNKLSINKKRSSYSVYIEYEDLFLGREISEALQLF